MKPFNPNEIEVRPVNLSIAKHLVMQHHYMKTFPAGAKIAFGIFYDNKLSGIIVLGQSSGTASKVRLFNGLKPEQVIEMQRMWISDELGHNAESKALSLMVSQFRQKARNIRLLFTYAGGCKNDCGIVYQSSGFIYMGSEACEDFYLTDKGEYKNIINVLRFNKVQGKKSKQEKAEAYYGAGTLLKTKRYNYCFLLDKGLRNKMNFEPKPFPKDSEHFRKDQQWAT